MSLEELLARLIPTLERARIVYMLTGSVASSAHGMPRSTLDLDIVIAATPAQLRALIGEFPGDRYYADEQQALNALANKSQFNVIDFATGWKTDFIIAEDSAYGRTALARRVQINVAGTQVYVASAEDVLIAKMRWAGLAQSKRQIQDAAGILATQGSNLDLSYVEQWVRELRLNEQWHAVREGRI